LRHNIDVASIMIILFIVIGIIKGANNEFSSERIFDSVQRTVNNILFIAALMMSIYLVKSIFIDVNKAGLYNSIYGIIPDILKSHIEDDGFLTYVVLTPVITLIILPVLLFLMSLSNNLINKVLDFFCTMIRKTHRFVRSFVGIVIETPKIIVIILSMVFLNELFTSYYPTNIVAAYTDKSRVYNYIYNSLVQPIASSSFSQKVPVFLQNSVDEVSKGIKDSKIVNESEKIKSIGFLRFQLETKSSEGIDRQALKIIGKETDDRKKAYLLYKWIGNNINYDWEKYNNIVSGTKSKDKFGAIVAFNTRKGVCEDFSDLYVAMARAVGLKVRIIVGQGYSIKTWGGHAWNEVYIPSENIWVPLDTTWARSANYFDSKDFYKDHIIEAVAGEWQGVQ